MHVLALRIESQGPVRAHANRKLGKPFVQNDRVPDAEKIVGLRNSIVHGLRSSLVRGKGGAPARPGDLETDARLESVLREDVALIIAFLAGPVRTVAIAASLPLLASTSLVLPQTTPSVDTIDRTALSIVGAIHAVFRDHSAEVWPGYDLSKRPYVLYRPDRWALLLNPAGPAPGFSVPPASWSLAGITSRYHAGRFDDLVGQLEFDMELGGEKLVAVPLPPAGASDPKAFPLGVFAFVVHEAFHQYQSESFAEGDSLSEERYPIEDADNTALALLELRLVKAALEAEGKHDSQRADAFVGQFIAVRQERWRTRPYVQGFETYLEAHEGTAKYVEVKALALAAAHSPRDLPDDVRRSLAQGAYPSYLLREIDARTAGGVIKPFDVARNRVYPVGVALGLLLDSRVPDWKKRIQFRDPPCDLFTLLASGRSSTGAEQAKRLDRAKREFGYVNALSAAKRSIEAYRSDFRRELGTFLGQHGIRAVIRSTSRNLRRSRSSTGTRWTMEEGRRLLCNSYVAYTLKGDGFSFSIRNRGVLEEIDTGKTERTTTFFLPSLAGLRLNDAPFPTDWPGAKTFEKLELSSNAFELSATVSATLKLDGTVLAITLHPVSERGASPPNPLVQPDSPHEFELVRLRSLLEYPVHGNMSPGAKRLRHLASAAK